MGHFTIKADVASLAAAQLHFTQLSEQLGTGPSGEGGKLGKLTGDSSGWTGVAATKCLAELGVISTAMIAGGTRLASAATATKVFHDAVKSAIDDDLVKLNSRWSTSESTYTSDCTSANAAYNTTVRQYKNIPDEDSKDAKSAAAKTRSSALTAAATTRDTTQKEINGDYDALILTLQTAAKTLGSSLAGCLGVTLTAAQWASVKSGAVPPGMMRDIRSGVLGPGSLVHTSDEYVAGEKAAKEFNDKIASGNLSPEEIKAYLATLDPDNEAFRTAFLTTVDMDKFRLLQDQSHGQSPDVSKAWGTLTTAFGTMLAKNSTQDPNTLVPMPAGYYDKLVKDYEAYGRHKDDERFDPSAGAKGRLLLAELIQAGQGDSATWNSDFLAKTAHGMVDWEREMRKKNPMFSWMDVYGTANGTWPTAAGYSLVGDIPGRVDALSMMFDALSHDKNASLHALLGANGAPDKDMLHYLYDGRGQAQGMFATWQDVLGSTLYAATDHKGPGGPGSDNYASAVIVSDVIGYYGTHGDLLNSPMLDKTHLADILANHPFALNNMDSGYTGDVMPQDASSENLALHMATSNLTGDSTNAVLRAIFAQDYYSHEVTPKNGYPLYGEIAAAQQGAFRLDFANIQENFPGDETRLHRLAERMSGSTNNTSNQLISGLRSSGASEDVANAEARKAADWVLGLGVDKVLDKTGLSKAGGIEGMALDFGVEKAKGLLLDSFFPETDHAGEAVRAGNDIKKYTRAVTGMTMMNWLDEGGNYQTNQYSPQEWAKTHPNATGFLVDGHLPDIRTLYNGRFDEPDGVAKWNQFNQYWTENGDSWLQEIGVKDAYDLGYLISDNNR